VTAHANPLDVVLGELKTALQYVAPIDKYKRELFKNGALPRYVWAPAGGPWRGARATGRNPRILALWPARVDVYCFGADDDACWRLTQALASAVATAVKGRNYQIQQVTIASPAWLQRGQLWVVQTELDVAVPEAAIPTTAGDPVTDNEITTVQPEAVAQVTPPLSTSSDGVLEGTET
jgi:hypothetical protein